MSFEISRCIWRPAGVTDEELQKWPRVFQLALTVSVNNRANENRLSCRRMEVTNCPDLLLIADNLLSHISEHRAAERVRRAMAVLSATHPRLGKESRLGLALTQDVLRIVVQMLD